MRAQGVDAEKNVNLSDIEQVTSFFNRPVIQKALLRVVNLSNIRPAFTTTVYAFLNPKLPSAAWDFFCLRFGFSRPLVFSSLSRDTRRYAAARRGFFDYY
ncbi:hypothetical protein HU755_21020 [Pseudomonas sp. SWRI111]|uniref:hypothetical protein n=1 Tax=Pseudomonas sp. SWRI111 TaxID=2745507 RepID=UPI001647B432|nr:hypothetical protein [Pseudomonas sp. SWRI111]MBC3209291.1 hypothetical protein [Pseudomonas sp. SWRI111]